MERRILEVDSDKLRINNDSAFFLHQSASWAKFIAIAGFILIGVMLLIGILVAVSGSMIESVMSMNAAAYGTVPPYGSGMFGAMYLIIIVIYCGIMVIPIIYLWKFAAKIKQSLPDNDPVALSQALHSLKNYFVFNGIMIIIALALLAIGVLMMIPAMLLAS